MGGARRSGDRHVAGQACQTPPGSIGSRLALLPSSPASALLSMDQNTQAH
jgi:hypothetical protein